MRVRKLLTPAGGPGMSLPRHTVGRSEVWFEVHRGRYVLTVQFRPWRGLCCRSVRILGEDPNSRLLVIPPPEFSMKKVLENSAAVACTAAHLAAIDCTAFSQFPALVAHCCVVRYDDGDARQPGWFTVKTRGAAWIVQVKDPDSCCQLQATGNSLDDAMALAELLLSSDQAPWEPDLWLKRQNGKSKKAS